MQLSHARELARLPCACRMAVLLGVLVARWLATEQVAMVEFKWLRAGVTGNTPESGSGNSRFESWARSQK